MVDVLMLANLGMQDGAHATAGDAAHTAGAFAHAGLGPWYAMLIPGLPLLGFVLCALLAAFRVKNKLPAIVTVAGLAASFVVTLLTFKLVSIDGHGAPLVTHAFEWINFSWGERAGLSLVSNFAFYLDSLTILWMLFVTGLATLIALYSSEYMSGDAGAGYCRYFAAFNLFVFSMACLVMGDNLLLTFLGWEGVGLCSYLLIGYHYKSPPAVAAAKKAFILNRIGDLGFILGIMSIFVAFGTLEYDAIFAALHGGIDAAGNSIKGTWIVQVIPFLFAVGAFGKSAQIFLYVWLPDAMEGPTPVSALIHAATMVTAGVYLVARMMPLFAADDAKLALTFVAWSGAITAFWAATIGMAFYDIKRVMGYSTVSQLGYMFAGLGVLGSSGAVFHVFTHAFFKATLFLCCGAVMHGFGGQLDLRKLSGVGKLPGWKITMVAMLVGCINLAGVPFTAGFFSKDMILAQAFSTPTEIISHANWIGWLLLLTAGMTAYYTFRVFFRVFVGPTSYEPGPDAHGHGDDHGHGHDHGHDHGHAKAHDEKHGHGDFHPHAPGWAMNSVMAIGAILSLVATAAYFVGAPGGHGGWVGDMVHHSTANIEAPHGGTIFGKDPHAVMYYVSGVVGTVGILLAFVFQLKGRREAATAPADRLFSTIPGLKALHTAANNKWYVDELYDFLIRTPLYVISQIFHLIDQYLVDGLVNLAGALPREAGKTIRPTQSGELHGYAVGMAGGVAVLLVIIILVAS